MRRITFMFLLSFFLMGCDKTENFAPPPNGAEIQVISATIVAVETEQFSIFHNSQNPEKFTIRLSESVSQKLNISNIENKGNLRRKLLQVKQIKDVEFISECECEIHIKPTDWESNKKEITALFLAK